MNGPEFDLDEALDGQQAQLEAEREMAREFGETDDGEDL